MAKYTNTQTLWDNFGEGAYTKVRDEIVGTGSGGLQTFTFARDKLISGSTVLYSGSSVISSSLYTLNLDDGKVTLTTGASVVYKADYNYASLPDSHIQKILNQAEDELEKTTGRKYNITTTSEYLDVEPYQQTFWLSNYPVVSLISLSSNEATSLQDSPKWVSLVEGIGNDFILEEDEEKRQITFIDSFPTEGKKRLKVDYIYGYANTPDVVTELSILLAQRKMINSGIYKSVVQGNDFTEAELAELNNRINRLTALLRKHNIDKI